MRAEKYFEKNGKIFGVSEKFEFGKWVGYSEEYPRVDVNGLLDPWFCF